MIVRAIDSDGDWLFGKSLNDYKSNLEAVKQNIQTRLLCFLGDCFFDITAGLDWFTFLGGYKNELAVSLSVSSVILNTNGVTGIKQLTIGLTSIREFSVYYQAQTAYSITFDTVKYTTGV